MFPSDYWLDPCPIDWDANTCTSGLEFNWQHTCMYDNMHGTFVNPPYSDPLPWVKKAIQEYENGCNIVMLLKHDSSTEWYRLLHEAGAKFLLVNKRLKYCTKTGAAFPSVLAVLA